MLEAKLAQWAQTVLQALSEVSEVSEVSDQVEPVDLEDLEVIAIDGKTLRGSRKQGAKNAHLLSALSQRTGLVLGQVAVDDKTNEITAVLELLANIVLQGKVVTTDALLTQHKIVKTIVEGGGDYLLVVKDNQPLLRGDIQDVFEAPAELGLTRQEISGMREVQEVTMHGNRIQERVLRSSTALNNTEQLLW